MAEDMGAAFARRFGDVEGLELPEAPPELWTALAGRGSCRRFEPAPLRPELIETLCALALSAPSKSDLQQRDILIVRDTGLRRRLDELLTAGPLGQPWIARAPHLLVILGNNRRQRLIHGWRGHAFANDHLDAFFNAAVDAGIALSALVLAAEAMGLGTCPISAIRNQAEAVSELLGLPDHVFPVAALALGRPAEPPPASLRLPLAVTVHRDRYQEDDLEARIAAYDHRRAALQPYPVQRDVARFGEREDYGWSEDKARQYARPERADFGAYVRARGFRLD